MVMFDLPPPLQCKGIEAYEQTGNCSSAITSPERRLTSKNSP
jgi:hypothetical protein